MRPCFNLDVGIILYGRKNLVTNHICSINYYPRIYSQRFGDTAPAAPSVVQWDNNQQNQGIQPKTESMSATKKLAIGTGILTVISLGILALSRRNGSKILKNLPKSGKSTSQAAKNGATRVARSAAKNEKSKIVIEYLEKVSNPIPQQNKKFAEVVRTYEREYAGMPKNSRTDAQKYIKELVPHSYNSDNSYIQVVTRTFDNDFTGKVIDVNGHKFFNGRIIRPSGSGILADSAGNFLVQNLCGKKLVQISVPVSRCDSAGRTIRQMISILSKGEEFTPLQKDLIEIISHRKQFQNGISDDILSLGLKFRDKGASNSLGERQEFDIVKDILLSSIRTAKEKLPKKGGVDADFIRKALALKDGERLCNFG